MTLALDITRTILTTAIFTYAAYSDYKTGEVTNKLWLYAITIGAPLTALTVTLNPQQLTLTLLSIITSVTLALTLFYLNAWGGADTKALITLAVTMPLHPYNPTQHLYPLTVTITAILIALNVQLIKTLKNRRKKVNLLKLQTRFLPYFLIAILILQFAFVSIGIAP